MYFYNAIFPGEGGEGKHGNYSFCNEKVYTFDAHTMRILRLNMYQGYEWSSKEYKKVLVVHLLHYNYYNLVISCF